MVTGDRDLFQVVDDDAEVRVLYIARGVGKHERVDNAWVRAKYDIEAAQYVDFAMLRGDASDGLPGVAGIGEKTAASLINSFGGMDEILAAASGADPPRSGAARQDQGGRLPRGRSHGRRRGQRHRPGPDGAGPAGHAPRSRSAWQSSRSATTSRARRPDWWRP